MKSVIGFDNGVTATIGIIREDGFYITIKIPIIKVQDYTNKNQKISRINVIKLKEFLNENIPDFSKCRAFLERPFKNSKFFNSSISAMRAWEALLIILDDLQISYETLDSKRWQHELLPKGCKGDDLKKASKDIGNKLFPLYKDLKHPDRDGILIAEYGRKQFI